MVYKSFTLLGSEIFTRLHLESNANLFYTFLVMIDIYVKAINKRIVKLVVGPT